MPPKYVKPYVKRNKNDMADAEAICEAVTRPTMRFVEIKTPDQQAVLMLHRTRQLFVRQRTTLINALRAHLAEFGIVAGVGRNGLERLLQVIEDGEDDRVPSGARDCLLALRNQLEMVKHQVLDADRSILAWHRASEVSLRLDDIPGVGPLIASALVASVPDPHIFKSGRDMAAWIGLVPRQNSTGGKERLGHNSKAGNRYLRMLLVVGAMSVIPPSQAGGVYPKAMANQVTGTSINENRRHRSCQQDCPHRLGYDGTWNVLSGACVTGSLELTRAALAHTKLERMIDE